MCAGGRKCTPCEDAGVFRFFLLHNEACSERCSCLAVFCQPSPALNRRAARQGLSWGGSRGRQRLIQARVGRAAVVVRSAGWRASGPASEVRNDCSPWGEGAALGEPRGGPLALGWAARWGVSGQGRRQEGSLLCVRTVSPEHRRVQAVSCEGNNETLILLTCSDGRGERQPGGKVRADTAQTRPLCHGVQLGWSASARQALEKGRLGPSAQVGFPPRLGILCSATKTFPLRCDTTGPPVIWGDCASRCGF